MEACLSESLGPVPAELTQFPIQLSQGLSPLCLCFRMDQIRQPLHLGQAQLPVGKSAPSELAGLGWP